MLKTQVESQATTEWFLWYEPLLYREWQTVLLSNCFKIIHPLLAS